MKIDEAKWTLRGVAVSGIVFGILGGVFWWWVPLGMVLSLTGLVFGFVDWTMARRRSLSRRLSILAVLVSVVTLLLCIAIAMLGWQTVTFGPLRN